MNQVMRLRNTATGVQILVTEDKADKLIASRTYDAVPDTEQPTIEIGNQLATTKAKGRQRDTDRGATDIASAIASMAGPQ